MEEEQLEVEECLEEQELHSPAHYCSLDDLEGLGHNNSDLVDDKEEEAMLVDSEIGLARAYSSHFGPPRGRYLSCTNFPFRRPYQSERRSSWQHRSPSCVT